MPVQGPPLGHRSPTTRPVTGGVTPATGLAARLPSSNTVASTTTAGGTRCTRRTLTVRRRSIARLPGLSLSVPSGATGRVSYTLRATRGVFSALTAKRPSAGLLLGP